MGITVNELLKEPFWYRNMNDKMRIVKEGKPRPELENLKSEEKPIVKIEPGSDVKSEPEEGGAKSDKYVMYFDVESYDHVEWMTGCNVRQALFCWPCLLFKVRSCEWNKTGIKDLTDLNQQINVHEKSVPHIQAALDLQLLKEKNEIEQQVPSEEKELIKRNREIVQRLIDIVCFLCSLQKKPRTGSYCKNTLSIEDCLENVQFLRNYDLLHCSVIEDAMTMLQITPQIINDLVDAITSVMKMAILKETHQSTFVSMIMSEHSSDPTKSQMSTVLRYLKRGEVCERFIGFINSGSKLDNQHIVQHMSKVITEFQISRRMIAYSIDGPHLSFTALQQVKTELLFSHPYVYFVPCYYHKLDTILEESMSSLKECDFFFKNLKVLKSCLNKESKIWQLYQSFQEANSGSLSSTNTLDPNTFSSIHTAEFLKAIKSNKKTLIAFFEFVTKSDTLPPNDLVKISGIKSFFSDFMSIYLLETFIILFDYIVPVVEACRSHVPGLLFDTNILDSTQTSFYSCTQNDDVLNQITNSALQELKKVMDSCEASKLAFQRRIGFRKIFTDIVKIMNSQFKFRFESAELMSFCHILNLEQSAEFLNNDFVRTLHSTYGQSIQYIPLEKEIQLVVANKSLLSCESVHRLMKFFFLSNLNRTVPNLYRLSELVLTLPCTLPTADYSGDSKLSHITPWIYKSGKQEVSGDLSVMCIERDLLEEVRMKETFFEEVIAKFQEKNKSLELTFKT